MLWKSDGKVMKTPSEYDIVQQDIDKDSYRSTINATLNDTRIAKGMHEISMSYDFNTEEEANEISQETYKNPMNLWLKSPFFESGVFVAQFRCAKRSFKMIKTDETEETSKNKWRLSFNLTQKKKVNGQ